MKEYTEAEIRAYLIEQGYKVPTRGRLATELKDIFIADMGGLIPEGVAAAQYVADVRKWISKRRGEEGNMFYEPLTETMMEEYNLFDFMDAMTFIEPTAAPKTSEEEVRVEEVKRLHVWKGVDHVTRTMNRSFTTIVTTALY